MQVVSPVVRCLERARICAARGTIGPRPRESVEIIRGLIANKEDKLDGRWDRVILAGIGMGAATGVGRWLIWMFRRQLGW